jgi:hypothetical protein
MKAVALLALIGLAIPAAGQSTGGNIAGVVTDASGARVTGATITITNVANGRNQTLTAGEQGQFRVVALQPAPYRLVVESPGFARTERDLVLSVGSEATLDVRLTVAGVRETIAVAPVSFDTANFYPSSLVTFDDIRTLPDIGRNFLVLAQLIPGSGPLNTTPGRFATTKFGGAADQRSGFTTMLDGGDVDDTQWGGPTINVTQESVREFRVFRHQFDAQYGNALNALVSVVTRAGSNRRQGSAFYFGRDDTLNARNAFAQRKPPFDEQRAGVAVGGPLAKDRTHLFGAYEHDHVDTARIIALPASNPFAAHENGIFPARTNAHMASLRLDHRISNTHTGFVRYTHDTQSSIRSGVAPSSDSSQVDTFSRAHSIVGEIGSSVSTRALNTLRVHWFAHSSDGTPHTLDRTPGIQRPSVSTGQTVGGDWQTLSRTRLTISDALYLSGARHDLKFGGEISFGTNELDSHFFEDGFFIFRSDLPFDPNSPVTWPTSFQQQPRNVQTYRARQLALFIQDNWRAATRLRLNLGVRYDLDPTLRINDFYEGLLRRSELARLNEFVSDDRGTDTNNLQPRLGATYDLRGDGRVVLRGGWGMYVARNRPWFQLRSMNQVGAPALLVEDSARLRLYPDISAILAGGAPLQLGTVIPDDFVQSYSLNTTIGTAWQFGRGASLEVDYVHSYADRQTGFTDRNIPSTGAISAANPRPVREFTQVWILENFTKSWYNALETQLLVNMPRSGRLRASYTLSRSYLDGVDFFNTVRGTQRTPHERGYSPSDQRHNLTAAASFPLPWRLEVSAIVKVVSGSPMPVQAGMDLDADRSPTGDRPPGLAITIGRDNVEESLRIINEFRAGLTLPPIHSDLLRLDPYRSLDMRLTKVFQIRAPQRLELTLEAFNLTNHVNYNSTSVNRNLNSPSFLERRTARDARQIQWGIRYSF